MSAPLGGHSFAGWGCSGVLTAGEGPRQQGDVVAAAPGASVQVVPELVVGGEVNDGGRHCHHPAGEEGGEGTPA